MSIEDIRSLLESEEYTFAVNSLANAKIPDFSDWPHPPPSAMIGYFAAGFKLYDIIPDFSDALCKDVEKESGGLVCLVNSQAHHGMKQSQDYERFWVVGGATAAYFYLYVVSIYPPQRVRFGPYLQPFMLDPSPWRKDLE